MSERKFVGICGILFVLLSIVIVFIAPVFPSLNASPDKIHAYYSQNQFRFLLGNYIAAVAIIPGLILVTFLSILIRRAEGADGWLWILTLGSSLVAHTVAVVDLILYQGVAFAAGSENQMIGKAMSDLASVGFGFFLATAGGAFLFAGYALFKVRILSPWLSYGSIITGLFSLVASYGSIVSSGPLAAGDIVTGLAFGLMMIWSLGLSWILITK